MEKINGEKLEKSYVKIDAKIGSQIDAYQHDVSRLQKQIKKLVDSDNFDQEKAIQIQSLSNELVIKMTVLSMLTAEHSDLFRLTDDIFE